MPLDPFDKLLAATLVLFGVMAVLHDYAGLRIVSGLIQGYGWLRVRLRVAMVKDACSSDT